MRAEMAGKGCSPASLPHLFVLLLHVFRDMLEAREDRIGLQKLAILDFFGFKGGGSTSEPPRSNSLDLTSAVVFHSCRCLRLLVTIRSTIPHSGPALMWPAGGQQAWLTPLPPSPPLFA